MLGRDEFDIRRVVIAFGIGGVLMWGFSQLLNFLTGN